MNYLTGTGLLGAIMSGVALLRGSRETKITWRAALAWFSWAITFALAIGAVIDTRRLNQGKPVSPDSPLYAKQQKDILKKEKNFQKELKRARR
ncbi:hypothetical protein [Microbacterium sp. NPDC089695]|uniref:hypothetical protein n=1 Tax=Microbacterium sp. NPDC089695 TaxID=3364198 RepID=UPI0038267986